VIAAIFGVVSSYKDPFHDAPIKDGLVQVPNAESRPPTQTEWDKHEKTRTLVRATGAIAAVTGLGLAASVPKGLAGWALAGGLILLGGYGMISPPGGTSETTPPLSMA
jgi:hypothetical protein